MKNTPFRCVLILGLLALSSTVASASVDSDVEAARIALKDGHYDQVILLTQSVAKLDPGIAPNWYRMAIAAAKTGDFAMAQKALKVAQTLDPVLSFASSPARVEKLQSEIAAGLSQGASALSKPALDNLSAESSDPIAVLPYEPVASDQIRKTEVPNTPSSNRDLKVAQSQGNVDGINQSHSTVPVWIIGFVLTSLLSGILIAYLLKIQLKNKRDAKELALVTMPLDDLVNHSRDNIFILKERLELHGHEETALYQNLVRTLKALELESGRARVNVAGLVEGVALSDMPHKMDVRSMVLGKDDSRKLHQSIAQQARLQIAEKAQKVASPSPTPG